MLPVVNSFVMPNAPNYNLGAWAGCVCDTLTNLTPALSKGEGEIKIHPNPANDYFKINYQLLPNDTAQLVLYDVMGNVLEKKSLYGSFKSLLVHTNNLSNDVYSWSVFFQNKKMECGKLVVIY